MTVQWIALGITILVASISVITGIYQSGQAKLAALSAEKTRADLATMKLDLMDKMDVKLDDFVRANTIKDYIEGHGKEHTRIEQELTRLRDWKEDTDGRIRSTNTEAKQLEVAMDDIKRLLKTIKDQAS